MTVERLTIGALMERLGQYPADCPVVVHSYEAGYDPVTDVESRSVTRTPHREWYVGVYDEAAAGERVVLIASRYYKAESEDT